MTAVKNLARVACGLLVLATLTALAVPAGAGAARFLPHAARAHRVVEPWIEGVTPKLEDQLFHDLYQAYLVHNVLKVYVFDAGGYQSAGIRFSARVAHEPRDLTVEELEREAAALIRTTFDGFPKVQTVDVWASIPVPRDRDRAMESTVYSVSADRAAYETMRAHAQLSDQEFLKAFGRIWVAPEVPPR